MKNTLYQIAAAFTFFTRLPFWKLINIPSTAFSKLIMFWPLTGWLTGGLMAVSWLLFSCVFPPMPALILTIVSRVLLTGGLHEDGLGDFFDGFGASKRKIDILRIMKDSHVGGYALIGIVLYYLLLINVLSSIPEQMIVVVLFVADPFSKFLSGLMMNILPYARSKEESKAKIVFEKITALQIPVFVFFGLCPALCLLEFNLWLAFLLPILIAVLLTLFVKRRIQGYTGDVSGAMALLCELGFYLAILMLTYSQNQ